MEIIKVDEIIEKPKKKFNFKQYYVANPDFRQRHLEKCKEHIICTCGANVMRCHMSRHKSTKKHIRRTKDN